MKESKESKKGHIFVVAIDYSDELNYPKLGTLVKCDFYDGTTRNHYSPVDGVGQGWWLNDHEVIETFPEVELSVTKTNKFNENDFVLISDAFGEHDGCYGSVVGYHGDEVIVKVYGSDKESSYPEEWLTHTTSGVYISEYRLPTYGTLSVGDVLVSDEEVLLRITSIQVKGTFLSVGYKELSLDTLEEDEEESSFMGDSYFARTLTPLSEIIERGLGYNG